MSFATASSAKLDLVILVGTDGQDATKDFDLVKQLAQKVLSEYDISLDNTRVGIIQYGKDPRLVARLNSYTDKRTINSVIDTLRSPSDGNRVDKALDLARTDLFNVRNGARQGVPKTLLVFTNKEADLNPGMAAEKLRSMGVKIIVVGVGGKIGKDQVEGLVKDDNQIFLATTPESATNMVAEIAKTTLPGIFSKLIQTYPGNL